MSFIPETYNRQTGVAGPLSEWERSCWLLWRLQTILNSGSAIPANTRLTCSIPQKQNRPLRETKLISFGRQQLITINNGDRYFLKLHDLAFICPATSISCMTSWLQIGNWSAPNLKGCGGSLGAEASSLDRPIYKIVRSVRIIRPEAVLPRHRTFATGLHRIIVLSYRVIGEIEDPNRKGRDADSRETLGKTWVRSYLKYEEHIGQVEGTVSRKDPGVVIKVKQTLQFCDYIDAHLSRPVADECQSPSEEWIACERAKLSAGLRYVILKRDGFRCRKCGKSQVDDNFVRLEVDHILPVSKWGRTIEENLETLCRDCNKGKSDQ